MKILFGAFHIAVGAMVFGTVFTPLMSAGCADLPRGVAPTGSQVWRPSLMQASYKPGSLVLVDDTDNQAKGDTAGIVGLWKFLFTSEGNSAVGFQDGTPLDFGYVAWHSDGTEITNSGTRDPATGNFCLGVWTSTGRFTYKLNHFTLGWDNTGKLCTPPTGATSCFAGTGNIIEQIRLDPSGNSYTGTLIINTYNPSGELTAHLTGTVSAQRLTAN